MLLKIALLAVSISLCACSTVGNVVPIKGKTMEEVYDGIGKQKESCDTLHKISSQSGVDKICAYEKERGNKNRADRSENNRHENNDDAFSQCIPAAYTSHEFKKLSNPALLLYVYPHFAGSDEVPIPGYHTVFNAFERDHYALSSDVER